LSWEDIYRAAKQLSTAYRNFETLTATSSLKTISLYFGNDDEDSLKI